MSKSSKYTAIILGHTIGLFLKKLPLIALFCCVIAISVNGQKQQPNILFIYTDDQAAWTLGISGNHNANTPNLDHLAQEGAYFKNAFVTTPVCSPARASIMTSQYATEYGIHDFIAQPGHKLYDPDNPVGLDPASITFAEVLQKAGYKTGLIGKWHLGDWIENEDKKYHPTNHGFDYFMGLTGGGTSPENPPLEKDGKVSEFKGLTTDILTNDALEFIENNRQEPFLLCLNYRAPHGKFLPVAPEDWAPYESMDPTLPNPNYPDLNIEKAKQKMREYLASVSGIDRNVGRILASLKQWGIDNNTIIIFSSDHGYNMGHNGIEHKGNGIWITNTLPPATENITSKYRPNLYDNSLKVPAIIFWPGVTKAGTVIEENISSLDWYPTIVEMAGAKLPAKKIIRGHSLIPLLNGGKVENWNNDFYAEYSMINYCKAYMRSYRTTEWKLVRDFLNPERDELYNIAKDPEENINMIYDSREEIKAILKVLDEKIREQMQAINDPLLKRVVSKGVFPK
ncbi:MAG: N-acetylgalactosamine-6-sulfatase [Saprospiraceae bacterium]|nr:MAG: N-acetylgalactosamine-6-sulfatase [Saprospiraceae bacterium]